MLKTILYCFDKKKTAQGAIFKVRVGNIGATLVLRCLSEPESEAGLRSVRISEIAQKLTEIATYFSNEPFLLLT